MSDSSGVLIGLDVGTTNTKAVVFRPERGDVSAVAARPTPYTPETGPTREIEPEALWATVAACLREVVAVTSGPIQAVGVASMAEAGVPLDAAGRPLYRIIPWYDPRTEPQLRRTLAEVGAERLFRVTGQASRHVYSLYKLQWLRENQPGAFRALRRWLSVADYVVWRLTGAAATDPSLASRTMLFDQRRRAWSAEQLDLAGVATEQLPVVLPSGATAGRVTEPAAQATGLPVGVPVAVGGHDHLCGAVAAGGIAPGQVVDSIGTAESVVVPVGGYRDDVRLGQGRICSYAHVVPGLFVIQGGMALSGGALAWLAERLYPGAPDPITGALAAAEVVPPGSDGLLFYPYLGGNGAPVGDENVAAGFIGLRSQHEPGHLVRALLEGVAFGIRDTLDVIGDVVGEVAPPIRVVGGGARSPLWLQIRADVLGLPVEAVEVPEAVAVGAALLAGVGAGVFADAGEAAAAVKREAARFAPDARARPLYEQLYREGYRVLYPALKPIFATLNELRSSGGG
jgi:xylulokinase